MNNQSLDFSFEMKEKSIYYLASQDWNCLESNTNILIESKETRQIYIWKDKILTLEDIVISRNYSLNEKGTKKELLLNFIIWYVILF